MAKIAAIIVGALVAAPGIEGFIHDHEAHAVGEFEEFGGRRVVAGANGVAAHRMQDLKLALQGPEIHRGAQSTQVVVIADAVHFEVFAVNGEAFDGVIFDGADPELGFVDIDDAPILSDRRHGHVTMRRLGAPEFRIGEGEAFALRLRPPAGGNRRAVVAIGGEGGAVRLAFAIGGKDLS